MSKFERLRQNSKTHRVLVRTRRLRRKPSEQGGVFLVTPLPSIISKRLGPPLPLYYRQVSEIHTRPREAGFTCCCRRLSPLLPLTTEVPANISKHTEKLIWSQNWMRTFVTGRSSLSTSSGISQKRLASFSSKFCERGNGSGVNPALSNSDSNIA